MAATNLNGTIHLVRHGLVENPTGVIYGRLPGFSLSDVGRAQAEAAADHLADAAIGSVWSSPMERAQETAAPIAARHDLDVTIDDRLIESETTLEGVARTLWRFFVSPRRWWKFRNPWTPTWGESFGDIRNRMLDAIGDALRESAGKEVVIVSHQTPVQVARLGLQQRPSPPWLARIPCSTGSVTTLVLENGRVNSAEYFAPIR